MKRFLRFQYEDIFALSVCDEHRRGAVRAADDNSLAAGLFIAVGVYLFERNDLNVRILREPFERLFGIELDGIGDAVMLPAVLLALNLF